MGLVKNVWAEGTHWAYLNFDISSGPGDFLLGLVLAHVNRVNIFSVVRISSNISLFGT